MFSSIKIMKGSKITIRLKIGVNNMAKQQPDLNAKKALEDMKLEIANDLNIQVTNAGKVGGTMTRKLVEMGEKQLIEDKNQDTFNPS